MTVSGFVKGLIGLMRPMEWSKSFLNMAVAAITAGVVFSAAIDPVRFAIGFFGVAFLWSGLYTLNDYTDRKADALHEVKKHRAIPSGRVPAKVALGFALFLIALSFAIGILLNDYYLYLTCLVIMFINQILYTMKPFNFKKRPVLDLVSGSLVNPAFRFYAGWTLFIPAFNAPIMALVFILGLQFGGYGLYRVSSTGHEKNLNYKSSSIFFGERKVRWACYYAILAGAIAYVYLCLNSLLWPYLPVLEQFKNILGYWPPKFFLVGLLSLLAFPFYIKAMKRPQESDMKRMYKVLYVHNILFILGMIVLYIV